MSRATQESGLPASDPLINPPTPPMEQGQDRTKGLRFQEGQAPHGHAAHDAQVRANQAAHDLATRSQNNPLAPAQAIGQVQPGDLTGELDWEALKQLDAEARDLERTGKMSPQESERLLTQVRGAARGRQDVVDNYEAQLRNRTGQSQSQTSPKPATVAPPAKPAKP